MLGHSPEQLEMFCATETPSQESSGCCCQQGGGVPAVPPHPSQPVPGESSAAPRQRFSSQRVPGHRSPLGTLAVCRRVPRQLECPRGGPAAGGVSPGGTYLGSSTCFGLAAAGPMLRGLLWWALVGSGLGVPGSPDTAQLGGAIPARSIPAGPWMSSPTPSASLVLHPGFLVAEGGSAAAPSTERPCFNC